MKGSCNCNMVQFEFTAQIHALYQCHCKLCQKQSGSTSNTATIVHKNSFAWLSGSEAITTWQKESGFSSHFCSACGSPVPNLLRSTDYYWIPMGLVEDCDTHVSFHLCCQSKAQWDNTINSGKTYEDMPTDLSEFIKQLSD